MPAPSKHRDELVKLLQAGDLTSAAAASALKCTRAHINILLRELAFPVGKEARQIVWRARPDIESIANEKRALTNPAVRIASPRPNDSTIDRYRIRDLERIVAAALAVDEVLQDPGRDVYDDKAAIDALHRALHGTPRRR